MDRRKLNSGFLLLETCLVVLALTMLSSLYLSMREIEISPFWQFGDEYLLKQSEALRESEDTVMISEDAVVAFNENGHVSQADTIVWSDHKIVIELGGGRLVFK